MTQCETFEMQISALLDGEISYHEQIMLTDHLLSCSSCRDFYNKARELQDLVDELPMTLSEETETTADQALAYASELESSEETPREHSRFRLPASTPQRWLWAAAAVLVFLIGIWSSNTLQNDSWRYADLPETPSQDEPIDVLLASDSGRMDDSRFVALTLELLRGDQRYHSKMYEILAELQAGQIPVEGEASTALNRNEGGFSVVGNGEKRGAENSTSETDRTIHF
ncbi:MAG: hypothetical protein GY835_08355 [bacterium]|nr:hypothetical protein [bacterium]